MCDREGYGNWNFCSPENDMSVMNLTCTALKCYWYKGVSNGMTFTNNLCAFFLALLQVGPSPKWTRNGGSLSYIILQP